METGIECLGTSAGSSQLLTQQCLFLSNPERGWPCSGLGLLRAKLNHLTLICNFHQLINLGFFKCPQAALRWFGLPWWCAGVWVMRQSWEKPEAPPFSMRAVLELRLLLLACSYCLGLKPDSVWLTLLAATQTLLFSRYCGTASFGVETTALPSSSWFSLIIFSAGELSPWVSHASLLQLLSGLFDLRTSVSRGFLRVSKLNWCVKTLGCINSGCSSELGFLWKQT